MEKAKQIISKLGELRIDLKLNGENLEIVSYQSKVPVELIHEIRTLKEFEALSYFELKKLLSETFKFKKEYFNCTYNFTDFHITKNINKAFKGKETLLQEAEKSETPLNFHIASVEDEVLIELSFYKDLFTEAQKAQLETYIHAKSSEPSCCNV